MVTEDRHDDGALHKRDIQVFQLYVTGASPNSSRAITNLRTCFDKYLKTAYELNIIDVYQLPQIAQSVDIIALPLLIRKVPLPERRLIGDMSDEAKIARTLGFETPEPLNDEAHKTI
jgi:circadian clock protein KaiB